MRRGAHLHTQYLGHKRIQNLGLTYKLRTYLSQNPAALKYIFLNSE